jgi:beta-N-acetylglucosaminidase
MEEPKKKRVKKIPIHAEDVEELTKPNQLTDKEVDKIIAQALVRYKDDLNLDKKVKFKEMSHLNAIAEEYLNCFLLVGYSMLNEKVVIFNANNPKDEAAVVDLLRSTFLDIANNRP